MLNLLLLKLSALLTIIVVSQSYIAESASENQKYFKKVSSHGKYIIQLCILIGLLC